MYVKKYNYIWKTNVPSLESRNNAFINSQINSKFELLVHYTSFFMKIKLSNFYVIFLQAKIAYSEFYLFTE